MTRTKLDKVELLLLALCAAVLAVQLFVPPSVGMADNGGFGGLCARFSMAHVHAGSYDFSYFAPQYWFPPEVNKKPDSPSSEMVVAAPPILIARAAGVSIFDIRWVGVMHCLIFLAAYFALLIYLRPWSGWPRLVIALAALWIFADVGYVAYFNSLFRDTTALLGILLMVPLALRAAASKEPLDGTLILFSAGAVLYLAAKPQHLIVGLLPVLVALWLLRAKLLAVLLICGVWAAASSGTSEYPVKPLFNMIFHKITVKSPTPQQDLADLGLGPEDLPLIGSQSGDPDTPLNDPQWTAQFQKQTGYRRIIWFYVRHPLRTLQILGNDLRTEAPLIRPLTLGNYRREEGLPPGTLARHAYSWLRFRSGVFVRWPWHIVIWFALFFGVCVRLARYSTAAAVALGVATVAVAEFLISSLGNGIETNRHLLMFHLLTDVTILFALGWLVNLALSRAIRRDTAAAHADPLPASS